MACQRKLAFFTAGGRQPQLCLRVQLHLEKLNRLNQEQVLIKRIIWI